MRCLAAIVFMMLPVLLLLPDERTPGASAGCKCLMSTIASSSSEMVTGTAQAKTNVVPMRDSECED